LSWRIVRAFKLKKKHAQIKPEDRSYGGGGGGGGDDGAMIGEGEEGSTSGIESTLARDWLSVQNVG